jgi:hypothetical protein
VTQERKIFSSCHADFIGELGALKEVSVNMFTQPRVLSQQPSCIHLEAHLKKRFTVIKSNGQCKQAFVKKLYWARLKNALQVSEKMWREPIESKAKVVKERCGKLSLSGPVWGG